MADPLLWTKMFRALARDHMGPKPVEVARNASIGEAVHSMAETGSRVAIVRGAHGRPAGILTEQDVVRRVAWRANSDQPVEEFMSTPVVSVSTADHLLDAITTMRRHRLSHLPVLDGRGRVAGLLALHEVLFSLSALFRHLLEQFTQDDSAAGLSRIKASQASVAAELLREDIPIAQLLALLTEIDLELTRRALGLAIEGLTADGWGPPPVPFAVIVMGSVGRGECLLAPDQDNGFILADYEDAAHARIDAYFVSLAIRFTQFLDEIGFPLCIGNVMATNPVWRKRISEWRKQIGSWLRRRTETQLLLSDILVDFQHVCGDAALSQTLRRHLMQAIATVPTLARDLFAIEADRGGALTWFGRLRSERDKQDRPGMINLKLRGSFPVVAAARLLSLKAGVSETSTHERLEGLAAKGILHPDDYENLKEAFDFISRLLLRQQVEDAAAGREINDFVSEDRLRRREKDQLVVCLRNIANVRETLATDL